MILLIKVPRNNKNESIRINWWLILVGLQDQYKKIICLSKLAMNIQNEIKALI